MAVFQVLAEMVGAVEFFGLIAFAEFVGFGEVFDPAIPVRLRVIWKFFSTIAAGIMGRAGGGMWRGRGSRVESGLESGNRSTRPGMPSQM